MLAVLTESLGVNYTCAAGGASSPGADHRQRTILYEGADMQLLRQCKRAAFFVRITVS